MKLRCKSTLGLAVVEENVNNTIEKLHVEEVRHVRTMILTAGQGKQVPISDEVLNCAWNC
jgi:hypothetical protein